MKINKNNFIKRFDIFKAEVINEGAWGSKPLQGDTPSDWKWKFGKLIYIELVDKFDSAIKHNDLLSMYHCVGMWEYFKDRHEFDDDPYDVFVEDQITKLDSLANECLDILSMDYLEMGYKTPSEVKEYLDSVKPKFKGQKKDMK